MTDLAPTWVLGSVDLTDYPFSVDRDSTVDVGEPEMIVEVIPSAALDGDDERVVRHGNRVYKLDIYVEGPTLADVADAEALLRAELRRPGLELTHNPGDDFSVASVYEVKTARLTPVRDDAHEQHLLRKFTLTLTCAPWARSAEMVTVEALAPPPVSETSATITNADTTTGFSASKTVTSYDPMVGTTVTTSAVTVTDAGSYAQATATETYLSLTLTYTTSAVSMATTRYLSVEMSGSSPYNFKLTVNGVSSFYAPVLTRANVGGTRQYVFDTGGGSLTSFVAIGGAGPVYGGTATVTLNVHDISRTDTVPRTTNRQSSRIIVPGGTERTPASIRVASADGSTDNGLTIVHTSPALDNGFAPDLTRWRVSGNTQTTDTSTFSGKTEPIHPSGFLARLPVTAVASGGYLFCAILKSNTVGTFPINWALDTRVGGTQTGLVDGYTPVQFYFTNTWHFVSLALETLPLTQAADGEVSAVVWYQGGSAAITQDEAFLFPVNDDSALTVVHGTLANLWLDSPSVTSGSQPQVWMGEEADRSDQRHPGAGLFAPGNHILHPDGTTVFAATQNADNPAVSSTHYKRWHSNAAE